MAAPRPLEEILLKDAEAVLWSATKTISPSCQQEVRFQILEAAAAQIGGFNFDLLTTNKDKKLASHRIDIHHFGKLVATALRKAPIHPSLSLSSLARPTLNKGERRSKGVYYTDFRLAQYLTSALNSIKSKSFLIVDPACGTGILLVAAVLALSDESRRLRNRFLAESICGMDLSGLALRGALLSLASLTNDPSVIAELRSRLRKDDSLICGLDCWSDVAPHGFNLVIGNPPWEKLKVTRHEWLRSQGVNRHYGEDYSDHSKSALMQGVRSNLESYVMHLESKYQFQGRGEHDLYKLFLELSLRIARPGGQIALLVPAGLIRSMGTTNLRSFAFKTCSDVELTVLENRARFFEIDTRFKFMTFQGTVTNGRAKTPIRLIDTTSNEHGIVRQKAIPIGRSALRKIRPDLSVPEVRTTKEWRIFHDFSIKGDLFGDPNGPWRPQLMREVDMTRDRRYFLREKGKDTLPLIEGRMVHQYKFPAKRYISGTGRRAIWLAVEEDNLRDIIPQFYFPTRNLTPQAESRVKVPRIGFCDITGQTNERTMLASRIPSRVVCGNKVPTVLFESQLDQQILANCWLAIANSIPFDWLLRRIITTTVNYFLLFGLPIPKCTPDIEEGLRLAELSCQLSDKQGLTPWARAEIRAEIDWRVLASFGHDTKTMEVLLEDFPLLDRAQPPLPNEDSSTITQDLLLLRSAENLGGASKSKIERWIGRVELARAVGAIPYIPSHLAE